MLLGGQHPDHVQRDPRPRNNNWMIQDQRRGRRATNPLAGYEKEELTNTVGDRVSGLRARAQNQADRRQGQRDRVAHTSLPPPRRRRQPSRKLCEHPIHCAARGFRRAQDGDQR